MSVEAFVAPSQSAYIVKDGKVVGHMSLGGPTLYLETNGKMFVFEMHYYFGPCLLTPKTEEPTNRNPPKVFWDAYERWEIGGKLVDGSNCVVREWCRMCKGTGNINGKLIQVGRRRGFEAVTCPDCGGGKLQAWLSRGGEKSE